MNPTARSPSALFWLLLPFAIGYGLSYFFRNVNAVAAPALVAEFGLGPGGLGFLTSTYFFAFAAAQIPLGLALDRFGPARVNTLMILSCAAGAIIFALASSAAMLGVGRALIGLGAGAALMSSMSAVHLWVAPQKRATAISLITIIGGIGAVGASSPAQLLMGQFGWRNLFYGLAVLCAITAVFIWNTRAAVKPAASGQSFRTLIAGVGHIYGARRFWSIAVGVMLILGTMLAFQTLWAAAWMRDVAGVSDPIAIGNVLVSFNVGMTIGFVVAGLLGDALERRGIAAEHALKFYCLTALFAQAWLMVAPTWLPHLAWGLYAFGANALVLAFPVLARRFDAALTGRVNTCMNLLAFGSAFFLQWGIGMVLHSWPVVAGRYDAAGYYTAWLVLFAAQGVALSWLVFEGRKPSMPADPPQPPLLEH